MLSLCGTAEPEEGATASVVMLMLMPVRRLRQCQRNHHSTDDSWKAQEATLEAI